MVFGGSVALSGHLTGKNKDGKTVQVQADAFLHDGNYSNVASPTTATNGAGPPPTSRRSTPATARARAGRSAGW